MTGRPHRAVKVDENQAEIVADLRRVGALVWNLSSLGGKVLDLLVCWRGKCVPVEIKTPGHEDDLTEGEAEAIQRLQLVGVKHIIAARAEDVLEAWEPSWQVVDQAAVEESNNLMAEALELAAKLTRHSYASPHRKKRVYKLRDLIFKSYDTFCRALKKR